MNENKRRFEETEPFMVPKSVDQLRYAAYSEIMGLAYQFKTVDREDGGDPEKLQLYFYPSWNAIGVSLYTTHRNEDGNYEVHTLKNEEINFDIDIVDFDSYNKVMARIIPWLKAVCIRTGNRNIR